MFTKRQLPLERRASQLHAPYAKNQSEHMLPKTIGVSRLDLQSACAQAAVYQQADSLQAIERWENEGGNAIAPSVAVVVHSTLLTRLVVPKDTFSFLSTLIS